jgi:hypothetical protein
MYLTCARIYIGGANLAAIKRQFPRARKMGGRVYVGYDNASGALYSAADRLASHIGGYVETEAD